MALYNRWLVGSGNDDGLGHSRDGDRHSDRPRGRVSEARLFVQDEMAILTGKHEGYLEGELVG